MDKYSRQVGETADYLRKHSGVTPEVLICAGTGLGDCAGSVSADSVFHYHDIPNFPSATVVSHAGELVFGHLNSVPVVVMKGRFHLYEGYSPLDVTFPVRVMKELGVKRLIVSNASGGLNREFHEGDIMVIRDHINLTGENPLVGPNNDDWGLRFPDMITAYDKSMSDCAVQLGKLLELPVVEGVYAGLKGPSLETPAEMRFLSVIGADSVGFSTVQEVIAGIHAGLKILELSVITNINDPDNPEAATVEDVLEVAGNVAPGLERLIETVLGETYE